MFSPEFIASLTTYWKNFFFSHLPHKKFSYDTVLEQFFFYLPQKKFLTQIRGFVDRILEEASIFFNYPKKKEKIS